MHDLHHTVNVNRCQVANLNAFDNSVRWGTQLAFSPLIRWLEGMYAHTANLRQLPSCESKTQIFSVERIQPELYSHDAWLP